jgi:hypothetical protein
MKKTFKQMNEYWIVTENRTGRVIAHCGDINDAIMMVSLDSHNRSYSRHRFILDQIIDVTSITDKQLPGQIGLPAAQELCIAEGQGQPVRV